MSKLRADDPTLWKDPVAFLKLRMPNAYFKPPIPTCYGAWIVDVGDPAYCDFMLEQARRNIELLPDTDGICIDRLDWLRYYNPAGDDGVSWVDGRPARSLYRSWLAFTDKLGPLMHKADKVIFANTMTMRLELCRQLDGIYTEHGDTPGGFQRGRPDGHPQAGAGLDAISKRSISPTRIRSCSGTCTWASFRPRRTRSTTTASIPMRRRIVCTWITVRCWTSMRGRKWVLAARCVEAADANVKVNLFQTPGGYALPVTFAGKMKSVTVRVRNIPGLEKLHAKALRPGDEAAVSVPADFKDGVLELQVPLKRGCAMVVLTQN